MKIKEPALWEACKLICNNPEFIKEKIKEYIKELKKGYNE